MRWNKVEREKKSLHKFPTIRKMVRSVPTVHSMTATMKSEISKKQQPKSDLSRIAFEKCNVKRRTRRCRVRKRQMNDDGTDRGKEHKASLYLITERREFSSSNDSNTILSILFAIFLPCSFSIKLNASA